MQHEYPTNGISQPYELIQGARDHLAGEAWASNALASASDIYAFRDPIAKPASHKWITVREKVTAGGRAIGRDGTELLVMQVKTETARDLPNADKWHSAVQDDIANSLLNAWSPTLNSTGIAVDIHRVKAASQPLYAPDEDTLYTTSEYHFVIASKPA